MLPLVAFSSRCSAKFSVLIDSSVPNDKKNTQEAPEQCGVGKQRWFAAILRNAYVVMNKEWARGGGGG